MTEAVTLASSRRPDFSRRRFLVVLTSVMGFAWLAGCASIQSVPVSSPQPPVASPAQFFTLSGRISVRVGDKIESAQIRWTKMPGEERVQVFTPFGSQVAELVKSASGRATLRRGLETIAADSIDQLTRSLLGVPLDMDAIGIWTQGIGLKEDESSEQRFGNGDLWQVTVGRLQSRGVHRYASRLSAVKGDTVVRMVIDEWQAE